MPTTKPRTLLSIQYAEAAQAYLHSLPLEHFMEATSQAHQRKITLESLDLLHARRPEVQVFNELLIQYPRPRRKRPGQVVPDNMVVICREPIQAEGSFDLPLQAAGPFWVLEYVSRHNKRKDYQDNFQKYERQLKVPYFLLFYPEDQELTLYRHTGRKYVSVKPSVQGRYAIPDLDLEVGLLDGWVRFWLQGQLLPLPTELQNALNESQNALNESQNALNEAQNALNESRRQLQAERQRAERERQARLAAEHALEQLRVRRGAREDPPPEDME